MFRWFTDFFMYMVWSVASSLLVTIYFVDRGALTQNGIIAVGMAATTFFSFLPPAVRFIRDW